MKSGKLIVLLGGIIVSCIIIAVYLIETDHFTQKRTQILRFEASEGTKDNLQTRAQYNWLLLRNPKTNEIPRDIGSKEISFVKKLAKQFRR